MHEYIPLVAGATLTAVDAIKEDTCDVALCWDGGRLAMFHQFSYGSPHAPGQTTLDTMHKSRMLLDSATWPIVSSLSLL